MAGIRFSPRLTGQAIVAPAAGSLAPHPGCRAFSASSGPGFQTGRARTIGREAPAGAGPAS
ncbi:hypothetical protein ACFWVC_19150 [Streptomyces sp. NPDC058691]|uniref:hypothetical protein n=1 Tax=Streptomyces sp. NPDC058691 TaxID=3346601 RepID=UPI003661BDDE